jgi:type IV secretory pathway TrbD component
MAPVILAGSLAFAVVFGAFVVALLALAVWIAVWAVRRDAAGRRSWVEERESKTPEPQRDEPSS